MNRSKVAPLFYLGTLISSVGSFSFNTAMIAFMLKSGFHLWNASLILGLNRLLYVLVMTSLGHLTDQISARKVVFVTEVVAAIASLCLYLLWSGTDTNYPLFALFCITRGAVVSFQTGSRSKIAKLMSDETYAQNSKNAIWLNKATQGATLFGGLIGYTIIKYFDFRVAIILDGLTFLTNGLFTLFLPSFDSKASDTNKQVSWHLKFKDFFKFNKQAASLDVVLAVIMMGTVAFQSRMAGFDQSWVGIYLASFGLAVWVSGFLERGITSRVKTVPFWFLLGISFFILGQLQGPGLLTLAVMFIKDLSYWIIFHRISAHVQADTPATSAGSVASARAAIMITILATGEILVGAWAQVLPITVDASLRALIGICVGVALFFVKTKRTALDERPSF